MQERPGEMRKESAPRVASGPQQEEGGRVQGGPMSMARSVGMPNPVKGLQLSLYPIVKEH